MNFINEYKKIYIYSSSLHQDLYQKLIKCFTNYIPIHTIPIILNEENIDVVVEEIVNNEDSQKSDTDIETFESIEDLKNPQEYNSDQPIVIILDDLNQKEKDVFRVQAIFRRSHHNNISIYIISQDNYELREKTIRAIGNTFHIFKPNNFRDVQNLYQDKASMDMTLHEFKLVTSTCWNEKYQPLTIDMTKDKNQGRHRVGLNSKFVPDSSLLYFQRDN